MVKREGYIIFNIFGPRLLDPPRAPAGLNNWDGYPLSDLIQLLPFARCDLAEIDERSDFIRFGRVFDYRHDSDLCREFLTFVEEFDQYLALSEPEERTHSFKDDQDFIHAAKYPFVFRQMLRGLIGNDFGFIAELPYLAEVEEDLLVSFELAAQRYYKQSIQMLRNALEQAIAHAYFGSRGEDYEHLASRSDFRMPSYGGQKGMLSILINTNVLSQEFADECRNLYALLSKMTHSHISHLSSTTYEEDAWEDWADLSARVGATILNIVVFIIKKGI